MCHYTNMKCAKHNTSLNFMESMDAHMTKLAYIDDDVYEVLNTL